MNEQVYEDVYIKKSDQKIVIFIHGIFSSHRQFEHLMKTCKDKGYSIFALALDGHGASARNLKSISYKHWIKQVNENVQKLIDKFSDVYIVAHSMGSLLVLNSEHINKVKKCVLIAPALKPKLSSRMIKLARHIDNKKTEDVYIKSNQVIAGVTFYGLSEKVNAIKPMYELLKLIRITHKVLSRVKIPLLIFMSNKDETLRVSGAQKIYNKIQSRDKKLIKLTKSYHSILDDQEKLFISKETLDFIS